MGIAQADIEIASRLFAKKTVLNEFLAFHDMGKGLRSELIFTCLSIPLFKSCVDNGSTQWFVQARSLILIDFH